MVEPETVGEIADGGPAESVGSQIPGMASVGSPLPGNHIGCSWGTPGFHSRLLCLYHVLYLCLVNLSLVLSSLTFESVLMLFDT